MYVYERLIMKHVDKIAQKKNSKLIFFHRYTKITIIYITTIYENDLKYTRKKKIFFFHN